MEIDFVGDLMLLKSILVQELKELEGYRQGFIASKLEAEEKKFAEGVRWYTLMIDHFNDRITSNKAFLEAVEAVLVKAISLGDKTKAS